MWISSIEDCYKILRVNSEMSFSQIEKIYHKEAIKYHKYRKIHSSYREHFLAMVAAFDCLKYINDVLHRGQLISVHDIFTEWQDNKFAIACDVATKYLQLNPEELESQFYKGLVIVKRVMLGWFFILGLATLILAFTVLMEYQYFFLVVVFGVLILLPAMMKIYNAVKAEIRISQRISYIRKVRQGYRYRAKDKTEFNDDEILSKIEKEQLPE